MGNFKNAPLTFADVQQMKQCAEFLDLLNEVKEETVLSSNNKIVAVRDTAYFEVLSALGLELEDVVKEITRATVGGYIYEEGLYLNLQLENEVPIFNLIRGLFLHEERLIIVTEDCNGVYDNGYGAFRVEKNANPILRAMFMSSLVLNDRPMTAWTVDHETFFLSPRRTLAEGLMIADNVD